MNAVGVYVQTAQLLLRTEYSSNSIEQVSDLNRLLGHLRQLLACAVCSRLLNDPFTPRIQNCQHNVCRLCVRGRKCLRPPCNDCKDCQDFKTYVENPQMRCLLLCFKSLCEHVMDTQPLFQQICKQKPALPSVVSAQPSTVPVAHMSTEEYIIEGASYSDITSAFATDLPKLPPIAATVPRLHVPPTSLNSQVPPLATSAGATSSMPVSALHILAQTQTAPKASTPPTTTLPVSSLTPVFIKQEKSITNAITVSPPPPLTTVNSVTVATSNKIRKPTTTLGTQTIPLKQFVKGITTVTTTAPMNTSNGVSNLTSAITYVAQNTPGVVVPIVSSSATTTAPLSIASSRLQGLNRQLAQVRRPTPVSCNTESVPPLAFKVSLAPTSTVPIQTLATASTNSVTTTATITSQQARNPPPIKTVSNGSAMYSVLYTGIGNKITIKRKTDGESDVNHKKNMTIPTSIAPTPSPGTVFRQVAVAKPVNQNKRRGCRCGNATPMPGKLTCCGQRCPCYVDSKSCIGCKCRGCRNPHRPDGGKVRPVIPELACYEIQMADESSSLSPKDSSLTNATTTLPVLRTTTLQQQPQQHMQPVQQVQQQQHQKHQQQTLSQFEEYKLQPTQLNLVSHIGTTSSNTTTTVAPTATLIPFRTLQTASQHQMQRLTTLNGSGNSQHVQHIQPTQLTSPVNVSTANTAATNLLQLENLQRESVLIQNADGNYQVVNLFTTGNSNVHSGNSTQIASLQRIHTISNANTVTATATNQPSGLQQIIVQQQPQTQQRHHNLPQRIISNSSTNTTSPTSATSTITTPLQQFQQHLKPNTLLTVHPIAASHHNPQQQQHPTSSMTATTPLISPSVASSATTITLSPIIVTSPNTLTSDMFSSDGSADEFLSLNNMTPAQFNSETPPSSISNGSSTTHLIAMPGVNEPQFSTIAIDSLGGNAIISSTSASAGGMAGPPTAHLTPALVEVIESNEL